MSVGHQHRTPSKLAHTRELKALLATGGAPALMRRWNKFDFDHDIPDTAGYNVQGTTRFADRDFVRCLYDPAFAEQLLGAAIDTGLSTEQTLEAALWHEAVEKVILDADNAIEEYLDAHEMATAAEHEKVRGFGGTPVRYERGLERVIKHCLSKDPKAVPHDLCCAPYLDDPDANDRRVLKVFHRLGVTDAGKTPKRTVNYGKSFGPTHCSICAMWQGSGNAALSTCGLVEGLVRDNRGCDRFEPVGAIL